MNLLVIMCDTFRRDHLGCCGGTAVETPHLDRLATESVVFDGAHACSFPTLPCRAELFTGRFVFPSLRWGPLPAGEVTLAQRLRAAGYHTAMVLDNLPVSRREYGYDRGFDTRIHVRGQWYDPWQRPAEASHLPAAPEKLGQLDRVRQYVGNVSGRRREEDFFAPQVMRAAADWLERFGRQGRFFLYIDCFDPHEPWDPPAGELPPELAEGERIIYPIMGPAGRYTAEEMAGIRALYAGEVRMVDRWIGRLLEAVDALGLREDTAVVFLSDHGVFLGEHGLIGKAGKSRRDVQGWPPYREVARIPLVMRIPGVRPRRIAGFVHPGDLMPTLLELAGVPVPESVRASSLLPLVRGEEVRLREIAVTAWSYRGWRSHHPTCIRSDEWSMIWWRTGIEPSLFHLPDDPGETRDLYVENRDVARWLHGRYVAFLKQQPCRPRNYWSRRFFFTWSRLDPPAVGDPPAVCARPALQRVTSDE